jgi:hypothetical protein
MIMIDGFCEAIEKAMDSPRPFGLTPVIRTGAINVMRISSFGIAEQA